MSLRRHLGEGAFDFAVRADHETYALGLAVAERDPESPGDFSGFVGREHEGQRVFFGECAVRIGTVRGDADHDRVRPLEFAIDIADLLRFEGAAGCVVFGVEINHDRLAAQAREAEPLSIVQSEGDLGRGDASGQRCFDLPRRRWGRCTLRRTTPGAA